MPLESVVRPTLYQANFNSLFDATWFVSIAFIVTSALHVASSRLITSPHLPRLVTSSISLFSIAAALRATVRGLISESLVVGIVAYFGMILVPAVAETVLHIQPSQWLWRPWRRQQRDEGGGGDQRRRVGPGRGSSQLVGFLYCVAIGCAVADALTMVVAPKVVILDTRSTIDVVTEHANQVVILRQSRKSTDVKEGKMRDVADMHVANLSVYLIHDSTEIHCEEENGEGEVAAHSSSHRRGTRLRSGAHLELFGESVVVRNCHFIVEWGARIALWNSDAQLINTTFTLLSNPEHLNEHDDDNTKSNNKKLQRVEACRVFSFPAGDRSEGVNSSFSSSSSSMIVKDDKGRAVDLADCCVSAGSPSCSAKTDPSSSSSVLMSKMSIAQQIVVVYIPGLARIVSRAARLCSPVLSAARDLFFHAMIWLRPYAIQVLGLARKVGIAALCGATKSLPFWARENYIGAMLLNSLSISLSSSRTDGSTCESIERDFFRDDAVFMWTYQTAEVLTVFVTSSFVGSIISMLVMLFQVEMALIVPPCRLLAKMLSMFLLEPCVRGLEDAIAYVRHAENLRHMLHVGAAVGWAACYTAASGLVAVVDVVICRWGYVVAGHCWRVFIQFMRVYCGTTFSVHVSVAAVQSAVVLAILVRAMRRLRQEEGGAVSSAGRLAFLRRLAPRWTGFPAAMMELCKTHTATVALYGTYHLVATFLVIGTSLVPFASGLHAVSLHAIFPALSSYAFLCFFYDNPLSPIVVHGPPATTRTAVMSAAQAAAAEGQGRLGNTVGLAPRRVFMLVSLLKAVVTVFVQKTLGDLLSHVVWEIARVALLAAVAVLGARTFAARSSASAQPATLPNAPPRAAAPPS